MSHQPELVDPGGGVVDVSLGGGGVGSDAEGAWLV